jgi:hypothetical protein
MIRAANGNVPGRIGGAGILLAGFGFGSSSKTAGDADATKSVGEGI